MRRFTTEPLTDTDLRKMLQKAMHELGKKLILNPKTFGNIEHMTSNKINFPKNPSVGHCAGSHWISGTEATACTKNPYPLKNSGFVFNYCSILFWLILVLLWLILVSILFIFLVFLSLVLSF